ncbi:MAG: acyl-CoA dehydrogenase family protein [Deltaproteobacteria bacterium]|nr:MAG: acyl-CoA dehydrogenase family protein [Deltaproteobacteria bacterium]
MDFRFTEAQESLRKELSDFCEEPRVQEILKELESEGDLYSAHSWELYKKMVERGWLGMQWPKEYGGQGLSYDETAIFNEATSYYRIPMMGYALTGIVGNSLAHFASEEQKKEYLPRMAAGEILFCVLYSEANVGSDLASLQTRAVEDEGDYVINGTKIFTSLGHISHYGFLAARTDPDAPKHKGISLFIVPMDAPGITINPMMSLGGERLNEIAFEDVRVPQKNLVGEKNKGWRLLNKALAVERSGVGFVSMARRGFEDILKYVREKKLSKDPVIRQKLARLATEIEVADALAWRVVSLQSKGLVPDSEAAMSKLYGTELIQRMANTGMELMGFSGLLKKDSKWAPSGGRMESAYRSSRFVTIAAGTSEIMKLIISFRGLGLIPVYMM